MPKIKVLVSTKSLEDNIEFETNAIQIENIVKYKENDETLTIFNYNTNELIRENHEFKMKYIFDENKVTYGEIQIKENLQTITVPIITKKVLKKKQLTEITYEIENNQFIYRIEELK